MESSTIKERPTTRMHLNGFIFVFICIKKLTRELAAQKKSSSGSAWLRQERWWQGKGLCSLFSGSTESHCRHIHSIAFVNYPGQKRWRPYYYHWEAHSVTIDKSLSSVLQWLCDVENWLHSSEWEKKETNYDLHCPTVQITTHRESVRSPINPFGRVCSVF